MNPMTLEVRPFPFCPLVGGRSIITLSPTFYEYVMCLIICTAADWAIIWFYTHIFQDDMLSCSFYFSSMQWYYMSYPALEQNVEYISLQNVISASNFPFYINGNQIC